MSHPYDALFFWLSAVSAVFFLGSLAAVPWLVGRLPSDCFLLIGREGRKGPKGGRTVHLVRNGVGGLVFLLGILMLFLPGQGLLTMVAGLILMEFPGKDRMVLWLIRREKIRTGLNFLRRKQGKPPFRFPQA